MPKQRSNIVAVLDLGSSKVVCFIARMGTQGRIEILGVGHHASHGIRAGIITDIKATEKSIIYAVEAAEKLAGESIQKIYIGMTSNNLISHRVPSEMVVTGHEINEKILNKLLFQVIDKYNDQEIEIIHSFPYDYMLDGNRGIESPLGMYGNKVSCDFHIISGQASTLLNIANCAARCQLEVEGYISSAYASGIACLTADEMDLGVTLIEFGGSCTSVSVFSRGNLIFTDGVPLGGINVTNDIARGLCTDFTNAERVKNLYGGVIITPSDEREMIEVPLTDDDDSEMNVVPKTTLVEIIRARVEEILEIIQHKLDESGVSRQGGNKIVITGGACQLSGMKELVGHIFSKTVRVGYPIKLEGLGENASGVSFATPVGMLIHLTETENSMDPFGLRSSNSEGLFKNLFRWLKQNFA
ncbi:cell division protein FtsA [Holosporaceae bacterium 'Namur']|nr:cell division protein FtsA [Holosporaceae bacterium 'Namur']